MPEGLKIQVGADVQQAVKGLKQLETQVEATFKKTGNVFSPAISKGAASLDKYTKSSNTATQATLNLSRVVQDAPFGFIGIANNLNPLLESFQRLKASTGTTGGALKAFGKSLTGAGGIGLGLSVVSSLLVVFGDKLFGAGKAAKEATDANEALAKSYAADIVGLTSLVAIIQNTNAKQIDRVNALKAINQEYGKYLGSLDKEKVSLDNIGIAYDKIIDSILRQAVVKGLQEEIEAAVTKTAASIIALEKSETQKRIAQENANKTSEQSIKQYKSLEDQISGYNRVTKDGLQLQQSSRNELVKNLGAVNNYDAALGRLKDRLKKDLEPLFGIVKDFSFDDLSIKLDKIKPGEVEKEFIEQFPKLSIPVRMQPTIDEKSIKFILGGGVNRTFKQTVEDRINKEIQNLVVTPKIYLSPKALKNIADQKEILEFAENTASIFNNTLSQGLSSGISGFAEGIGKALTGGGIGDAFNAFFSAIGGAIQSMGEQLIAIGVAALLAKKALETLFANPVVAIAAGAALAVAGAALKSLLSGGVKGFAAGGLVTGPQLALIGEGSGTSKANPEVVAPLDKLKGMLTGLGGGSQVVVMRTIVRGNNLALVQARTSRSQKRTTGR